MSLNLSDFDYHLPKELIAQDPHPERAKAKLLVLDRQKKGTSHRVFRDLVDYLNPGDCLVLNDTKVIPARLFGKKPTGGKVEVLLHKDLGGGSWEVLLKPGGRIKKGAQIFFGENGHSLAADVLNEGEQDSGMRKIRFTGHPDLRAALDELGHIPLPPYIDRPDHPADRSMYQTIFAKKEGAVASPTAGLHFDEALLKEIGEKGVKIAYLTLHVGYGTFQPVSSENVTAHKMHPETYEVTEECARTVNETLSQNGKVFACGTTAVRTLETVADESGRVSAGSGETSLFIYPSFRFRVTSAMITNFHLPRTTLLMLVSAFAGRDLMFQAYEEAVRERYRFYSYGDAMLIL